MRTTLFLLLLVFAVTQAVLPLAVDALTPPPEPVSLPEIAANPQAFAEMTQDHREAAVRMLRQYARAQYHVMADQLLRDTEARQDRLRAMALGVFDAAAWLALLVLLLPLFYWKRHRERRGVLISSSLLAALLFLTGIYMLGGLFETLNDVSLGLAQELDPKRAMLDASFDLFLDRTVPLLVEGEAPWIEVIAEKDEAEVNSFSERLFENLTTLNEYAFRPAMRMFRVWRQLAAVIPLALVIAAALLFLLSVRPVLQNIVTIPDRAASGEQRAVRKALGLLWGTVWREFLAIMLLVLGVIVLSVEIGIAMRQLNRAAIQVLVGQIELAVQWLGVAEGRENFGVVVAISALPLLLLVAIGLMAVSSILWTFHARRICRARFHDKVRLRDNQRFWRRTSWALIQVHWIPVIFLTVAAPAISPILDGSGGAPTRLVISSVLLVLGFAFALWYFRAWSAMKRLWRWAPRPVAPESDGGDAEDTERVQDHSQG